MFDQGRGFDDLMGGVEGGWGGFVVFSDCFFKHTCYRHNHHILTFHTSGDTWPTAFYHPLLADLMAKRQRNKCKADDVIFEFADAANAL